MTYASVVTSDTSDGVVIRLSGEIDLENSATVESQLHEAISNKTPSVVLELGDVSYIDSVGMRILFSLAATLDALSIRLTISAPHGSTARRVMELSGLEAVATLAP